MIFTSPTVSRAVFEAGTGWHLRPEGACKGDVCIPLAEQPPAGHDDPIDVADLASQLSLPVARDEASGVAAVGPESIGAKTLVTAEAPELTLPDWRDFEAGPVEFSLSSLRGRKVLMVAWSPY